MNRMTIGIMQPYFFPYLGYFQLIKAVDEFVVYDNIEYTKKGWFNRNRYLCNGEDKYFTIPIAKDSDFLNINCRKVAANFDKNRIKNQIKMAYKKAPYFENTFQLFSDCIDFESDNLFEYINNSLYRIVEMLEINTKIVISSSININHEQLKGKDKVLAICKELNGNKYINSIGGQLLYDKKEFNENGIELNFINMGEIVYKQFEAPFVPNLSILDVLMFNSVPDVKKYLLNYKLI